MISGIFEIIDGEDFLMKTASPEQAGKYFEEWETKMLNLAEKQSLNLINDYEEKKEEEE